MLVCAAESWTIARSGLVILRNVRSTQWMLRILLLALCPALSGCPMYMCTAQVFGIRVHDKASDDEKPSDLELRYGARSIEVAEGSTRELPAWSTVVDSGHAWIVYWRFDLVGRMLFPRIPKRLDALGNEEVVIVGAPPHEERHELRLFPGAESEGARYRLRVTTASAPALTNWPLPDSFWDRARQEKTSIEPPP